MQSPCYFAIARFSVCFGDDEQAPTLSLFALFRRAPVAIQLLLRIRRNRDHILSLTAMLLKSGNMAFCSSQ